MSRSVLTTVVVLVAALATIVLLASIAPRDEQRPAAANPVASWVATAFPIPAANAHRAVRASPS